MLVGFPAHDSAHSIVRVCRRAEQYDRLIRLGAVQELAQMLRTFANARNQDACCQRIERPSMADFHLQALLAPSAMLIAVLAVSLFSFGSKIGREERGGVEVGLEVAEDLGG